MKTVQDILEAKGRDVWRIDADATVFDALSRMAEKNVGALVVMEGKNILGVFSERDYARNAILKGKSSPQTLVKDVMTTQTNNVTPAQTVDECMAIMTDKRVRHLPVLEGTELVGIVSIGDLVKSTIIEQKSEIEQLEHYIQGY